MIKVTHRDIQDVSSREEYSVIDYVNHDVPLGELA